MNKIFNLTKLWGGLLKNIEQPGHHALMHQAKMMIPGLALTLLTPGSTKEKASNIAMMAGSFYLTMGMTSPMRQQLWGAALAGGPILSKVSRAMVQSYRGVLDARSSVHIPFSHSTLAMDQAYSTLQYAQSRLGQASGVSGEAAYMAARYLQR